ncbi:hypothetical protein BC940DRAFT_289634 [Gongronella butleri]|nr:hypothetical protein BC940DRAFT_289634 [Gongronella butleri]
MTTPPTIVHIPKSKKALGHARSSIAHASSPPSTGAFPVVQPSAGHGQQQGNAASLHKMQHQQHQHQHRPSDASHDPAITGDAAFLVSDSLYFEVPQAITDHDIFTLLMPCQPISIQRNKQNKDAMATGWIRFLNKESGKWDKKRKKTWLSR